MKRLVLIALTFLTVSTPTTLSDERIRVLIEVQAPEKVKALMESFMGRELRSLGDVTVKYQDNDTTNSDWIINVVAIETHTKAGESRGYGLAIATTKTLNIKPYLKENLSKKIQDNYARIEAYAGLWIAYCGKGQDDVKEVCTGLIATIDSECLQMLR